MKNNQALTMYPLFFDPIYKKAEMKKIDGKDCICYQEDFWGTKVEEDGSVTFTMEAPKAETVEVSGFGGTLGTEKIALEKQANGLFSKNVKDSSRHSLSQVVCRWGTGDEPTCTVCLWMFRGK